MTVDSWDAIDCLYAFGYQIMKRVEPVDPLTLKEEYKLGPCGNHIDPKDQPSVDLLLKEIDENKEYYFKRITEIGRKLL